MSLPGCLPLLLPVRVSQYCHQPLVHKASPIVVKLDCLSNFWIQPHCGSHCRGHLVCYPVAHPCLEPPFLMGFQGLSVGRHLGENNLPSNSAGRLRCSDLPGPEVEMLLLAIGAWVGSKGL